MTSKTLLITDFDGPIMDLSPRYYQVYQICLEKTKHPNQKVRQLSKEEFWELKRSRTPETEIAKRSGLDELQAIAFAQLRSEIAHDLRYLGYDTLAPGAVEALEKVQRHPEVDLAVMTMRRHKELEFALERYNLRRFFPPHRCYCISNDYPKKSDVEDKPLLMERALKEFPTDQQVWMIGDTEADIVSAQTHSLKSIAVLSGIRDRASIESFQPDFIVNTLSEAVDLALERL